MKPGEQVRDYILEQRIGSGGVGEVWRARHIRLNKPVAIKLILPHLCEDENVYSRFVQEAIATANLEHPHIISVHDFFSVDDNAYLVMSYVEGGSLQDRIRKSGRLSLAETVHIAHGILDALDFAHQKGIVHRDVKPSNILLSPESHAYLVDFGIALVLGKTRITRFGANIGTPDYMSPEQIRGEHLDHRTDVYSFGCVLYEMLTGRSPFRRSEDDTEFTLMQRHMNEAPGSMRSLASAVNAQTESLVMRALAKDREQRFAGCADMWKALAAAAETSVAGSSKTRDQAAVLKVAAAALALTTLVAAGGWFATYDANKRAQPIGSPAELIDLKARLDAAVTSTGVEIEKSRKELQNAIAAKEKAEKEAVGLRERLAASGPSDKATVAKLQKELQAANASRENALKEARNLQERLDAGGSSNNAAVAKLRTELQDARSAHERTVKELRQVKEQLAVREREAAGGKRPVGVVQKAAKEIAGYLSQARDYRERGAYDAALSQLSSASALDPTNQELITEIERTRRACNAEKRLGRADLKC